MRRNQHAIRLAWLSTGGNFVLAVFKFITGYFGNSYALIADAIESISDIFASLMLVFGIRYISRPADENHPYGHGRAEPLIVFLIVGFLVISAYFIISSSIYYITHPHPLPAWYTLYVLSAIILIKEFYYRYTLKQAKLINSSAMRADASHHRMDSITSLAAWIGIFFAKIMGDGYESADDWAAIIASLIILYNAFRLFRSALSEIMDEHTHSELENNIRNLSKDITGILNTEKCLIRKTGLQYHIDLHITVKGSLSVFEGHQIAHLLKDHLIFSIPSIADVLIHVEPDNAY